MIDLSKLPVVEIEVESVLNNNHAVADINPMMTQAQTDALVLDLEANGQLEPILIYRGKVVDGRNRAKSSNLLGWTTLKCQHLPHKTTKNQLMSIAMSKEVRRHQTKTQLAIKAMFQARNTQITQANAAKTNGVARSLVETAAAVLKLSPPTIDQLYAGNKYVRLDGGRTESLNAVLTDLKERKAQQEAGQFEEGTAPETSPKVATALGAINGANLSPTERDELLTMLGARTKVIHPSKDVRKLTAIVAHIVYSISYAGTREVTINQVRGFTQVSVPTISEEQFQGILKSNDGVLWLMDNDNQTLKLNDTI